MPSCPSYRIEHRAEKNSWGNPTGHKLRAVTSDGQTLGWADVGDAGKNLIVSMIEVSRAYRRCGVATRLYEAAATLGCRSKKPLMSSWTRSRAADEFWRKQVAKGRARCKDKSTGEEWDPEGGYLTESERELDCAHYVLKRSACKNVDLSGLKRRKRKKRTK